MNKKMKDPNKLSFGKTLAFSGVGISKAVDFILLGYLTYFCTNILGVSATLVGTMLLVSKVFDGITDIIAGLIIDRTKTRFGKGRPYDLLIVVEWVLTVILFWCPVESNTAKAAWIFIMYTLINSIIVTLLSAAEPIYVGRSIKYNEDRAKALSVNGLLTTIFCTIISILFPIMMGTKLGTTAIGWAKMSLMVGVPMSIIGLTRFFAFKETVIPDNETMADKVKFKDMLDSVKNKYIWIICGTTIMIGLMTNTISAVQTYYFDYVVGDVQLLSTIGMIGIITPFFMLLMPVLLRKMSVKSIFCAASVLGAIACFVRIFAGANIPVLILSAALQGLASMPFSYFTTLLVIDVMDFGEWKTGKRVEGAVSAVNGFAGKVASGLSSGFVGLYMGVTGFDGTLETQSAATINSIVALYSWIPAIFFVLTFVFMFLYDLDKKMPEIKSDLEVRRKSA